MEGEGDLSRGYLHKTMIDPRLFSAFLEGLSDLIGEDLEEKLAALSAEEERRRRHAYYVANRQQLLQHGRAYRAQNRAQIARKKKIYARRVRSGVQRQRQRVQTGGMSFSYMGYK